jgi:ankyrin repeat protein
MSAAVLLMIGAAASAQGIKYSDSYSFIKAVKDRDGNKATELIGSRGSSIISARDGDTGDTALHILVRQRDLNWLSFMLGKGARTNVQDKDGNTPLGLAAQIGWVEGATQLLARGAAADAPNTRGETPLILAVQQRHAPMVRLLLARGANPRRPDSVTGNSALDYAKQDRRSTVILKMLEAQPQKKEAAGPVL